MNALRVSTTVYASNSFSYLRNKPTAPTAQPWMIPVEYDPAGKTLEEQVQSFMAKPDSNIKKIINLADSTTTSGFVKACLLLGITNSAKMYKFANLIKSQISAGIKIALADTLPAVQACLDFGFTPAESKDFLEKLAPYSVGYAQHRTVVRSSAYAYLGSALKSCADNAIAKKDASLLLVRLAEYAGSGQVYFCNGVRNPIGAAGDVFNNTGNILAVCQKLKITRMSEIIQYVSAFKTEQDYVYNSPLGNLFSAYTALANQGVRDVQNTLPWLASIAGIWTGDLFAHIQDTLSTYSYFMRNVAEDVHFALTDVDLRTLPSELTDILFGINPSRFFATGPQEKVSDQYSQVLINRLRVLSDPQYTDDRPLAVILYAEADTNTAYSNDASILDPLYAKYRVLYYEVSTSELLMKRIQQVTAVQKASVLVFGGHGIDNGFAIRLGESDADNSFLIGTHTQDVQNIINAMSAKGVIIVNACFAAKGGQEGNNLVNILANAARNQVFVSGPIGETTGPNLFFDASAMVIPKVEWCMNEKTNIVPGYTRLIQN